MLWINSQDPYVIFVAEGATESEARENLIHSLKEEGVPSQLLRLAEVTSLSPVGGAADKAAWFCDSGDGETGLDTDRVEEIIADYEEDIE